MRHRLICGPGYAAAEIELSPGEELVAEAGAMAWMDDSIAVRTQARGGILKGLGRMITGESFFQNTYYAEGAPGKIALAPGVPGDVGVFVAGTIGQPGVQLLSQCPAPRVFRVIQRVLVPRVFDAVKKGLPSRFEIVGQGSASIARGHLHPLNRKRV